MRSAGDESTPEAAISFRCLERADFPLLQRWLAAPHVAVWWNQRADPESVEAHYGPAIDGREPIDRYVIEADAHPIGWIQWYRWRDYPEHATRLGAAATAAGIDLAIGLVEFTGRGLGPAAIGAFARGHIFVHADVTAIVTDPAIRNTRSVRAFTKAHFSVVRTVRLPDEDFERHVVRLDRA